MMAEPKLTTGAVVKVADGRGFIVEAEHEERFVITAAHCLPRLPPPHEHLLALPPPHPGRYDEEALYLRILGPLGTQSASVPACCLFVDPIADIAVLGQPDNQNLPDKADAYDRLGSRLINV